MMDTAMVLAIALGVCLFYIGHYLGYREAVGEFCDALKDFDDEESDIQ